MLRGKRRSDFDGDKGGFVRKCYVFEAACTLCPLADQQGVGVIAIEDLDPAEDVLHFTIRRRSDASVGHVGRVQTEVTCAQTCKRQ